MPKSMTPTLLIALVIAAIAPPVRAAARDTDSVTAACARANARAYYPQVFRSVDELTTFATTHDLLGVYLPNPVCFLRDIARSAGRPFPDGGGPAFRGLYAVLKNACVAGDRVATGRERDRICELPRTFTRYVRSRDGEPASVRSEDRLTEFMVLRSGLQSSLHHATPFIQSLPHRPPILDSRVAVASAELWSGYPVQGYRALFQNFVCGERTPPLQLDACRVQKDVLARALGEVGRRVAAKVGQVTDRLVHVDDRSVPDLRRLGEIARLSDLVDVAERALRDGESLDAVLASATAGQINRQIRTLAANKPNPDAGAAHQALVELLSFAKLTAEVQAHRADYPAIADAQFERVRATPELTEFARSLETRVNHLTDVVLQFIEGPHDVATQ